MFSTIKTAAFSALVAVTALSGLTAGAHADSLYYRFSGDGDSRAGITIGDNDGPREDGRRHRRDRDRWERACTPDRALDKAERMGIRRARIVDVDRRTIEVSGRRFGDRVLVVFARAPNCPVIR